MVRAVRRSEADIEAEARISWRGDTEKVHTASSDKIEHCGIMIESRYGKFDEMEVMADVVEGLNKWDMPWVKSIFCNSKASACYEIVLKHRSDLKADHILLSVCKTLREVRGGWNSVSVSFGDKTLISADCDWFESWDEEGAF